MKEDGSEKDVQNFAVLGINYFRIYICVDLHCIDRNKTGVVRFMILKYCT